VWRRHQVQFDKRRDGVAIAAMTKAAQEIEAVLVRFTAPIGG
jgi:hypothetical protein